MIRAGVGALALGLSLSSCDFIDQSRALKREATEEVKDQLKDPESARFRALRMVDGNVDGVSQKLVCGEVNARGPMGGYVGYTRFIYGAADKRARIGSSDRPVSEMAIALGRVRLLCKEAGREGVCTEADRLSEDYERAAQVDRVWSAWCGDAKES